MSSAELAAVGAAVLLGVGAAFQFALAGGAPFGHATFGGRAKTNNGVLTGRFRGLAVVQGLVLVLIAWIVLSRGGVVSSVLGDSIVRWATWVVAALMLLNTAGNLSAPHPLEKFGMGFITLAVAVLTVVVALQA